MIPNTNKYLLNGGELKVDLRTESGLMTGRRTLFFLEANWPQEILQQKEGQDIRVFYYPGTKNIDWQPTDPTKLWLTEEFFPGTTVYLEVQFWSQNADKEMQFISKCNKHGNIIKIGNNSKSKDVSDYQVNWKGLSLPKIAICFCCTPSCFKKLDPFMFIRMRFGNVVYQSQWFQLVFRKSTKRKRDSLKGDEILPQRYGNNEELAIRELSNFGGPACNVANPGLTSPSSPPNGRANVVPGVGITNNGMVGITNLNGITSINSINGGAGIPFNTNPNLLNSMMNQLDQNRRNSFQLPIPTNSGSSQDILFNANSTNNMNNNNSNNNNNNNINNPNNMNSNLINNPLNSFPTLTKMDSFSSSPKPFYQNVINAEPIYGNNTISPSSSGSVNNLNLMNNNINLNSGINIVSPSSPSKSPNRSPNRSPPSLNGNPTLQAPSSPNTLLNSMSKDNLSPYPVAKSNRSSISLLLCDDKQQQLSNSQNQQPPSQNDHNDVAIVQSLLKLEENVNFNKTHSHQKTQENWEELEKGIVALRSQQKLKDGDACVDYLTKVITYEQESDKSKENFLNWINKQRSFEISDTVQFVLSIIYEKWFHGQPTKENIERKLLEFSKNSTQRPFAVRINTEDKNLTVSFIGKRNRALIIHETIYMKKIDNAIMVSIHDDSENKESEQSTTSSQPWYKSIQELLVKEGIVDAECIALPKEIN